MQKLRNFYKKESSLNVKETTMTSYLQYAIEKRKMAHLGPY